MRLQLRENRGVSAKKVTTGKKRKMKNEKRYVVKEKNKKKLV